MFSGWLEPILAQGIGKRELLRRKLDQGMYPLRESEQKFDYRTRTRFLTKADLLSSSNR